MQLVNFSNKLKPLTIAASVFTSVPLFAYSDLDCYDKPFVSNNRTIEYIRQTDNNFNTQFMHQFYFERFLANWKQKTMFLSSTKAIVENEDFKSIVAMGEFAVPYIVAEIETNPSTLVWALNFIYNRKITEKPDATINEACKLWVKVFKK